MLLPACAVYRPDISQGQKIEAEDANQVTSGMTKVQVSDLLGTPLIKDSFHQNRWDYVYYLLDVTRSVTQKQNLRIEFEDGVVVRVIHDIMENETASEMDEANPSAGS